MSADRAKSRTLKDFFISDASKDYDICECGHLRIHHEYSELGCCDCKKFIQAQVCTKISKENNHD